MYDKGSHEDENTSYSQKSHKF